MAALSEGVTDVRYLLHFDDTERMLDGMRALGVGVGKLESHVFRVQGCGSGFRSSWRNYFCVILRYSTP